MEEVKFLTVAETAAYLNTSERFIRRLVAERRIAFYRIGKHLRFAVADVDEWISRSRVPPSQPRRSRRQVA